MQRLLTLIVLEQSRAREKTTRGEREGGRARERERASERASERGGGRRGESKEEKGVFRNVS